MAAFATPEMRKFVIVWLGQLVSLLGTGMTHFAMTIWVWDRTGKATSLVLVGVFSGISSLLTSLVAGSLVDRWNRKTVMIVSDSIAGLCSLVILLLYATNALEVWHLYVTAAIVGCVSTFQHLAFSAGLTLLIPKTQYARANSMMSLAGYASGIGAPLLAAVLVSFIGIGSVLVIDIITFLFAVTTLIFVTIPQPPPTGTTIRQPLWRDTLSGYQYIFRRPGLPGLLLVVFIFSLTESLAYPLIQPMILARTGDEVTLGTVLAVQGVGGVLGGILISIWGGPKRRIHGILIGIILTGLLGDALMGLGTTLWVWIVAAIFLEVFIPMIIGGYHSIWQAKVEPGMQGRVFAARNLLATLGEPFMLGLSGLLSDNVFEPAMRPGGSLAPIFGGLLGTGPGAGMALLMVIGGLLSLTAGLIGYLRYAVRNIETILPDHDEAAPLPASQPESA
jgi:MFS transporter, DHA3 family, macrolide efflux protein